MTNELVPVQADILPAPLDGERYSVPALTEAWLAEQRSPHTRTAYTSDLRRYLSWCRDTGLDPLVARPVDATRFRSQMAPETAARTVARRLAAVSSWYRFLIVNGACQFNPVGPVRRPVIDREETTTVGMSADEVRALLRAADQAWLDAAEWTTVRRLVLLRDRALLRFLAAMGMRRAEVVSLDVDSLGHNQGYRTVRYTGKGARQRERALPPHLLCVLDEYLPQRAAVVGEGGPLFVTVLRGSFERVDAGNLAVVIRRYAHAAGIASADRLSPHSLRHAFATNAREKGVALEDVQDAMGHADPRTTRGYDRSRHKLNREPALRLGELYEEEV